MKQVWKKSILIVPLLLAACAGMQATKTTTSDGKTGYSLTCREFYRSEADCQAKAGELCEHGYDVDSRLSYRETYPDSGDGIYIPAKNHIVVTCKTPQV